MQSEVVFGFVGVIVGATVTLIGELLRQRYERASNRDSWRRETMSQVSHAFLESSFAITGPAREARNERLNGAPLSETQRHLDRCRAAHESMKQSLSGLRLVAPNPVVDAAENLHDACHELINLAMGTADPRSDEAASQRRWDQAKGVAANKRRAFIGTIRQTFGVEGGLLEVRAQAESAWQVPADVSKPPSAKGSGSPGELQGRD